MATRTTMAAPTASTSMPSSLPHLRLAPYLTNAPSSTTAALSPSLRFPVVERAIPENAVVKVGRYTDRTVRQQQQQREQDTTVAAGDADSVEDILFKSKVVSRSHAEIWVEDGKFYIRDTASSSGTFLNHTRLSAQNIRSDAHRLRDGDCLQLGVEYRGGEEEIYRCVRMRVELNRRTVASTALRMATLTALAKAQLSTMMRANNPQAAAAAAAAHLAGDREGAVAMMDSSMAQLSVGPVTSDCCICLLPLRRTPLFLTPCAHAFHYACVRTLLSNRRSRNGRTVFEPVDGFSCPMCRSYIDLTAEPADEDEDEEAEVAELTAISLALGLSMIASPSAAAANSGPMVIDHADAHTVPAAAQRNAEPASPPSSAGSGTHPAPETSAPEGTHHNSHPPPTTTHSGNASTDEDMDVVMDRGALSSGDDADMVVLSMGSTGAHPLHDQLDAEHRSPRLSHDGEEGEEEEGEEEEEEDDEDDEDEDEDAEGHRQHFRRASATAATSPVPIPSGGQHGDRARAHDSGNSSAPDALDCSESLLGKTVQTPQPMSLLADAAAANTATHGDASAASNPTSHTAPPQSTGSDPMV